MEQYLPIIIGLLSGAAGGNIAGKLLKSSMGTMGRSLTGIVGGAGLAGVLSMLGGGDVGSMADAAQATTSSGLGLTSILKSVIGGGVGGGILMGTIAALIGWYIWAYMTYFIGTKLLPEPQTKADHGELLRTIGFASSPGLIRVLGIIPGLTGIVFMIASVWMLVAMVIAVRQALDYQSTWRAVGVCVIGWIIQTAILMVFVYILGGFAKPV